MKISLIPFSRIIFIMQFLLIALIGGFAESTTDARSLYQEGIDSLAVDNPYTAIEAFRTALTINPAYADARIGMAEALFQLSEYADAAKELEMARPYASDRRDLILLDARIKTAFGRYDEAAGIYRKLLEYRPHDADANRGLGEIYAITGQRDLADSAFSRSLQYAPGDRRVLLQLVLLHDRAREKEQSDAVLSEVLRLFPNNLSVRILAAEHYALYNEWSRAMDQLDKANSMLSGVDDKRFPRVALLNAELSLRKGDPASALESLDYLRNDPDPEIMYLMARSYRDLGREAEAQSILDRLLRTCSEDEIARMFREEYLMRTSGGFEKERDEAALWHLRKGAVFEENFYYRRAYNEFRRAKLLNKDNPDVWLAYTEIIRKLGYPEHYRDSLKAALFDIPESRTEYSMLEERLDLLEHSGKNSLAQRWEIEDPWNIPSDEWDVGVYVQEGCSSLPVHTGAEETLALYFADLMDILPDIRLPLDGTGRNPEVRTVSGYSQAFRESRESLDYFVLIGFTETSRTFSAVADLYLAGTGEKIGSFNQLRTGQSRVTDTLHMLAQSLSERVPRLLDIVSVNGNRVLLDKGRWQGIEKEQTWIVLRKGSAEPSAADGGLVYSRENYLGTVEIDEVSEPLSEGTYTRSGDFDFISPGDELYLLPVPETADNVFSAPDPAFKASLLAIP